MPGYDEPSTAGAALRDGSSPGDEGDKGGREDTFFLPHEYPGASDLQPGDMLQLRVVGKDADGQCEVEVVHGDDKEPGEMATADGKKPMMDDMEESLT
jgi:hypothetical protein